MSARSESPWPFTLFRNRLRWWIVESCDADPGREDFLSSLPVELWMGRWLAASVAVGPWGKDGATIPSRRHFCGFLPSAGRVWLACVLGAVECLAPAVRAPYDASDLASALTEDGTMVFAIATVRRHTEGQADDWYDSPPLDAPRRRESCLERQYEQSHCSPWL